MIRMKEKNKGITLIALIITIIVMLILVGVSVSILINSNLIGAAEKTATAYNQATQKETTLEGLAVNNKTLEEYINKAEGKINFTINGNTYEAYEGETLADWCSRQTFGEKFTDPLYDVGLLYNSTHPSVDTNGNNVWKAERKTGRSAINGGEEWLVLRQDNGPLVSVVADFYSTITAGRELFTRTEMRGEELEKK